MKRSCICIVFITLSLLITGCSDKVQWVTSFDEQYLMMGEKLNLNVAEADIVLTEIASKYNAYYQRMGETDIWNRVVGGVTFAEQVKDGELLDELSALLVLNEIAFEQDIRLSKQEEQLTTNAGRKYWQTASKYINLANCTEEDAVSLMEKYRIADLTIESLTSEVNEEVSDNEKRVLQLDIIFVTNQAIANDIHEKAALGEDFEELAAAYNEMDSSKFYVRRGEIQPVLEEAAFALESGQISDVIQTEKGYYIIHCVNDFDRALSDSNESVILSERTVAVWSTVYQEYIDKHNLYQSEDQYAKLNPQEVDPEAQPIFFEIYNETFVE